MRKLALTITCTACVFSAFGVFCRWLQNMTAFEENGLYKTGSLWGAVLLLLCIAAAAVLLGFTVYFRRNLGLASPPDMGVALAGRTLLHRAVQVLVVLIMLAGCVLLLFTAPDAEAPAGMDFTGLLRVLALLGILAAAGFAGITVRAGEETPEASPRQAGFCLASALPIAFCCFWLIVSYRQDAITSVVWSYAPEILAIACSLLAFYFVAGYAYGRARPFSALFFCELGAVMCFVTLPDERLIAMQLMFVGMAGMQLFLGWLIVSNMRRKEDILSRFPNAQASDDIDDELPPPDPEDEFEPMGEEGQADESSFVELPEEYLEGGAPKSGLDEK